jgi:hypothetical protein
VSRRARVVRGIAALVSVSALAACSIGTDASPRDIEAGDRPQLSSPVNAGAGDARGTARIYLLGPSDQANGGQLRAVQRDVPEAPLALLTVLLAGPNTAEVDEQLRTAIPTGTAVRSADLRDDGVVDVDMSSTIQQLSGDVLIDAVAQIVFTVSEVDGTRGVRLMIDGASRQWPAGDGELQRDPLTIYDFPGFLASAQPDYPALPSPS